ncbi:UbiX family flavin prenyltransferase [Streptococcus suis]|uniref:UbiX family flavin prenyltransferase n=2 Tax=Streptococcus suis TaxID=1307 RepID=UPI000CF535D8|nr:UbiX family flavin prenyltransferase [Streptococcus suis]
MKKRKIIIGITGASGITYAVNLLKELQLIESVETHVVMSNWARENLKIEQKMTLEDFKSLCDVFYDNKNLGASIASGSFQTDAMVIVPASMKSVAAIACGFSDNLIVRAADVILKEQRKLILVPRESPLSTIHLENLTKLSKMGAHIIPPMPAFYNHPKTIEDIVHHNTVKILDSLGVDVDYAKRWEGI